MRQDAALLQKALQEEPLSQEEEERLCEACPADLSYLEMPLSQPAAEGGQPEEQPEMPEEQPEVPKDFLVCTFLA